MIYMFSITSAGFSIIALILLLLQKRTESNTAKILGNSLLIALLGIQFLHILYITGILLFADLIIFLYLLLLGLVGPVFYLYSQHVLDSNKKWRVFDNLHLAPVLVISLAGYIYPEYFNLTYSTMFLLGGLYMGKLAWSLYQLRVRRTLFKMEFVFTALFLSWALGVVFIGMLSSETLTILIPVQTIMLAIAIAAAIHIQLNYPHLLSSLEEIAQREYQSSTLLNIDCDATKQQLEDLMHNKQVYQDSELSLSALAEMLHLKSYQLSELINTQLNMSFSTYLRQQRVKAAEVILKAEPDVSILAIGLSVGFSSQSAFYSAFKELHGMAPGQYRQKTLPQ